MNSWTTLKGFPRIHVEAQDGSIKIRQENKSCDWNVPLRILHGGATESSILEGAELCLPDTGGCIVVNVGQSSFCRVRYSTELLQRIKPVFKQLDVRDRVGVLSDLCSFVVSGQEQVENLLELLEWFVGETEWVVIDALLGVLSKIEALTESTKAYSGFLKMSTRILGPTLECVGWSSMEGEGNKVFSRAAVIERLGRLGCVSTGGEASLLFWREEGGRDRVPMDIRCAVYRTVARKEWSGRRRVFDYFMGLFKAADRSEEKKLLLSVLSSFTDEIIINQILDWCMTDEVKLQDRIFLINGVAENCADGRFAAWNFFKKNFDVLTTQFTSGSHLTRLVKGVTRHFKTEPELQDIKAFFQEHPLAGAQMTVDQTLEDVEALIVRRQDCLAGLQNYFAQPLTDNARG